MDDNPFDVLARFYDWEHDDFDDDVAFYTGLAQHAAGPVLEGACGTGRLLAPLLTVGVPLVGVDSSAAMLARARERLVGAGDRVRLQLGDLRTLDAGRDFALAIVGLDSFGFLLERSEQLAALRRLRAALRPDGLLAIDVSNGNLRGAESVAETLVHFARPHPEHGRMLVKWVVRETDHAAQVDDVMVMYDETGSDGTVKRTLAEYRLRYFCRYELEWLLDAAGFELEALYGDYDTGAYTGDSPRLLVVARNPGGRAGLRGR